MPKRFYNAHAHCFTYDHVPKYFVSRWIAVSWLLSRLWLKRLVHNTPITGRFGFIGSILKFFLWLLLGFNKDMLIRFINFVRYGDRKSQEKVIKSMQEYYPKYTGYVFLSMDMEYMGAGLPKERFDKQLSELEGIMRNPSWENIVYPFIFCDPRRLQPVHERELGIEDIFIGQTFLNKLQKQISEKIFQGIKLYPALGYYPFDKRMKPVYDFAVKNNLPLITHCTVGAVHFKYKLDNAEYFHPFLKRNLPNEKPAQFQKYFTHPLNFECLLNQSLLEKYWGHDDATDYNELKICIGHWGGEDEWHDYIGNAWTETRFRKTTSKWPSLELDNWHTDENKIYNFSWFTIICDMMRKYPNVYADISYTLQDATLLPLLKMILEADEKIRERVLFGTDFYLVSKAISEREFAINVRAELGNVLFEQIAIVNAERFLNNVFSQVRNEFWK